jgi:Secretion system C-terminal sorting domain/Beta-propeller repeat
MIRILGILLAIVFANNVNAQTYQWAKSFGVSAQKVVIKTTVKDDAGNVYSIGSFSGTVDFDPGPSVYNLTCITNSKDAFVTKLDALGNFVWAKRFGGNTDIFTDDATGFSIAVDALGNVIVAGSFIGDIDLNPDNVAVSNYTAVGATDIFLVKLNSAGTLVWSKQIGGSGSDFANEITTDLNNNILIVGGYNSTVDFDPNAGVSNITAAGLTDIFIEKIDANGNFVFAKSIGGSGSDYAYSIALDSYANIYTAGSFSTTADFDPSVSTSSTLTAVAGPDIYVNKLDAAGNFMWARGFGGNVSIFQDVANDIAVDVNGNVYITGTFKGANVDFDPGIGTLLISSTGSVSGDAYVSKFDNNGNLIFAKTFASTASDVGYALTVDDLENIYCLGSYSGTIDLDPDEFNNYNIACAGASDIYLCKLDINGNFVSANTIGSLNSEIPYSIFLDHANNIYCSGYYSGSADFDPSSSSSVTIAPQGTQDGFITKWSQCANVGSLSTSNINKQVTLNNLNAGYIFSTSNCNIIAKVIPNGASPISANTTAKVWIEATQPSATTGIYVKRHYEITPDLNATTATAKITLYFTQAEFDAFNAVSSTDLPTGPNDALGKANLLIEKRPGVSSNVTGLPNSYVGTPANINPADADIVWNVSTNRWEVTFSTTGFSGFFAKTQTSVLPVQWIYFNGKINNKFIATLNWKVFESNVDHYEIEKSKDGNIFYEIDKVVSNNFGENMYSYIDPTSLSATTYYRIKQVDTDGNFAYSDIVTINVNDVKKITVYPNPATNEVAIKFDNSLLTKIATLSNISGKQMQTFTISKNNYILDISKYASGIYFLKIDGENVEKIIKQ